MYSNPDRHLILQLSHVKTANPDQGGCGLPAYHPPRRPELNSSIFTNKSKLLYSLITFLATLVISTTTLFIFSFNKQKMEASDINNVTPPVEMSGFRQHFDSFLSAPFEYFRKNPSPVYFALLVAAIKILYDLLSSWLHRRLLPPPRSSTPPKDVKTELASILDARLPPQVIVLAANPGTYQALEEGTSSLRVVPLAPQRPDEIRRRITPETVETVETPTLGSKAGSAAKPGGKKLASSVASWLGKQLWGKYKNGDDDGPGSPN